jgi:tetratricopeptide (TPR) repeat protein
MGHYYEELFEDSGRSEHANLAIESYRKAYTLDPRSAVIGERLAEMYYKAQRIRDAVLELQEIIKREPENVSARRLLGRIYVRTLGERGQTAGTREMAARAAEQFQEIYRLDPMDVEAATWLARLYRMQGEEARAEDVLRSVLATDPDNVSVLRQLTQALMDRGDADAAVRLLEAATQRLDSAELFMLLGDSAVLARDYRRAEGAYGRALELEPSSLAARRKLAQCLLEQNKNQAALEQFKRLMQLDPDDGESHLRAAQIHQQLRQLDLAEDHLVRARQLMPGSLEVQYTEAMVYEDQGRFEDAIRVLSGAVSAVRANPRQSENRRTLSVLYQQLGRLYRETENFTAAVNTFHEMLKLGPEDEKRARAMLADTYREARDMPRAIAESEKALETFGNDRGLRVSHALLLGENRETDRATAMLRELMRGDASDREIYISLAQVYERGRRFEEAEKNVSQAEKLSRFPAENEGLWLLLGAIYERQKKYEPAEQQFRRVLDLNPRNSQALNYYGYMLADRGVRLEEAAGFIQRALDEEPHSGAYLDSLGWAFFKLGRTEDAEKYLRRAAERSTHNPTIREHLGDLYLKTGRPELAAREWERSLAEWNRAIPAERDEERLAAVDKKLTGLKHRLAQKPSPTAKPE